MIFDIILILIFIVLIIVNICRGIARSLANIIACVLAYLGAAAVGQFLADYLYETLVKPAVTKAVTDAIVNASSDAANGVVSSLPAWLTGLLNLSAEDLTTVMQEPISNASGTISEAVNKAIQPVATGLMVVFITVILFLLLFFILRWILKKPMELIFSFPILNAVNRLLGAVIGFVDAFLLVSMLAYLTKVIIVNFHPQSAWFNESIIYNSFIFYYFYSGNIFSWIISLITG